ncbi:MAG: VanZ family protein [Planctomycetes bacterium]|nr:VanZ family protein [Planctomycetota bacterium]
MLSSLPWRAWVALWGAWRGCPRWLRIAAVAGWAALIWWSSSRPGGGHPPTLLRALLFNAGHIVLFGTLAALVRAALDPVGVRAQRVAVIAAVAWGILDELHQASVPGRSADPWDVGTDLAAACLAVGLTALAAGDRASRFARAVPLAALGALSTVVGASL